MASLEYKRFGDQNLEGLWRIISLEQGTCTYRAAEVFANNFFENKPEILETKTFDEGILLATITPKSLLLVPHVHDTTVSLAYNHKWKTIDEMAFLLANPPIYLARNPNAKDRTCATLPRLQTLVREPFRFVEAENTQNAASMAANRETSYCITNQEGLDKNNLEIVRELKRMQILWLPHKYIR